METDADFITLLMIIPAKKSIKANTHTALCNSQSKKSIGETFAAIIDFILTTAEVHFEDL